MIAPDLAAMARPIESLHEDPKNARTHNDRNVAAIAESLKTFGQRKPIVVLPSGRVIAGNGTLRAAKLLGWTTVAAVDFEDEAQATAYALADNQTALTAGWDDGALAESLASMSDELRAATGFAAGEIDRILAAAQAPADDAVIEPPANPVTQPGDVYTLGPHRFTCGDSTDATDVARALDGASPFIMVTDPPYGVAYDPEWRNERGLADTARTGAVPNDDQASWAKAYALFTGDVAYVWHASLHGHTVALDLDGCGFQRRSQIIWNKSRFAISRGHYHWGHEPCWYAVRDGSTARWCGDRKQSTIWDIAPCGQDTETTHGTQKPVECMERPMRNHGARGDVVYDPFLGSGTSLIAAERTGRVLRGLELDPAYCDVIVARWEKLTGLKAAKA